MLIPLIAKPDGTLLAGHNRLKIAKELKHKTIPVRIVESVITDTVELEILVKDNVLRRQLTAQQKKNLIKRLYGKEIMKAKHGGSRGNQHSKPAKVKSNLAERIEQETGIKLSTVKAIMAELRGNKAAKVKSNLAIKFVTPKAKDWQAKARETVNGISKLPKEDQKKALKWLQAELKKSK